jgi:hypothetical protein
MEAFVTRFLTESAPAIDTFARVILSRFDPSKGHDPTAPADDDGAGRAGLPEHVTEREREIL